MKKLPAVTAYSLKGKVLVAVLRGLLGILHFFMGRKWATPPSFFHDDPRHYTTRDLLFFAYKYYFKSPEKGEITEGSQISAEDFFKQYPPTFSTNFLSENEQIDRKITLTAAGDLMPYAWIQPQFCQNLWDDIGDDFFSSDITFANLETPIVTSKPASLVPEVMLNDMHFNGDPDMFSIFNPVEKTPQYFIKKYNKKWSFDILSTANNHSLDMGEQGVIDTMAFLEGKDILHVGTAYSKEDRLEIPIIERNGIKIAFVAYTFSMNQLTNPEGKEWLVNHLEVNQPDVDLSVLIQDIACAKQQNADLIVLSLHYGNAYQAYPCNHIIENIKRIFDECGLDIILGGHPHNIQPMACYPFVCPHTGEEKRGFVIFSMGDFVAYDIFNWCHLPVYLKLEISQISRKNAADTEGVDDVGFGMSDVGKAAEIRNPQFEIKNTEGSSKRTILTKVEAIPVYTCGVYTSEKNKELRFLDARKTLNLIAKGEKPPFMTAWNVKELTSLMTFYKAFFAKNIE